MRNKFLPKLFLYRVCSKPRLFCVTCVKFLKFPPYQLTSLIGRETGYLDTARSCQQKFNLFLLKFFTSLSELFVNLQSPIRF